MIFNACGGKFSRLRERFRFMRRGYYRRPAACGNGSFTPHNVQKIGFHYLFGVVLSSNPLAARRFSGGFIAYRAFSGFCIFCVMPKNRRKIAAK